MEMDKIVPSLGDVITVSSPSANVFRTGKRKNTHNIINMNVDRKNIILYFLNNIIKMNKIYTNSGDSSKSNVFIIL
jgi:ABC-type enterochelin transport system substrate-binding protein